MQSSVRQAHMPTPAATESPKRCEEEEEEEVERREEEDRVACQWRIRVGGGRKEQRGRGE